MYYVPVYALIKIVANMTWVSCVCVICVVHMSNVCVYVLVHMSVLVCMFVLCVHACVHDYVRVHANLSSGGGRPPHSGGQPCTYAWPRFSEIPPLKAKFTMNSNWF